MEMEQQLRAGLRCICEDLHQFVHNLSSYDSSLSKHLDLSGQLGKIQALIIFCSGSRTALGGASKWAPSLSWLRETLAPGSMAWCGRADSVLFTSFGVHFHLWNDSCSESSEPV